MSKKVLMLVSLLAIASFVLTACGPKATEAPAAPAATATTAAPAGPSGEVTFWHAYGTGSAEEAAMTKLVEQAQKDLPNIKITVLQKSDRSHVVCEPRSW